MARKTVKTVWELWSYDVWGNASDGWTVNDRSCTHRAYVLNLPIYWHNVGTDLEFQSASPSAGQIRKLYGPHAQDDGVGDDVAIYINSKSGKPVGEMHCISHASLSPIRRCSPPQGIQSSSNLRRHPLVYSRYHLPSVGPMPKHTSDNNLRRHLGTVR